MTELEQYKKAYALLVGRVDTAITRLEKGREVFQQEGAASLDALAGMLTGALQEAEEIFLAGE